VKACPKDSIVISAKSNKKGFFPALPTNRNCTGCTMCAVVCPEGCIEIYGNIDIVSVKTNDKPMATKERL